MSEMSSIMDEVQFSMKEAKVMNAFSLRFEVFVLVISKSLQRIFLEAGS
jgi:hypothetical protein